MVTNPHPPPAVQLKLNEAEQRGHDIEAEQPTPLLPSAPPFLRSLPILPTTGTAGGSRRGRRSSLSSSSPLVSFSPPHAKMLETNTDTVRRYGPPQRNRMHNRRKSGDRFEKVNYSYGTDGEKSRAFYSTGFPATDHWEAGSSNIQNENSNIGLIPLDGCCTSEAAQLLNERWVAAMHSYNDLAVELSERPILYSGASGSSWSQFKLPHQMDFLAELRRAMHTQSSTVSMIGGGDRS